MASFGSADIQEINESEKTHANAQVANKNTDALEEERRGRGVGASSTAGKDLVINTVKKKKTLPYYDRHCVFAFYQLVSCAEWSEENFPLCWGKAIKRLVFAPYKRWIIEMLCLD